MGSDNRIPTLSELQRYAVNRKGIEGIKQPLYDHLLYPFAGATQLKFFAQPMAQGKATSPGSVVSAPKTENDTNMDVAGQLPAGKSFFLRGLEVTFKPGTSAAADTFLLASPSFFGVASNKALTAQVDDANLFYSSGQLELYIGSKVYCSDAPLSCFPPRTNVRIDGAVASTSATAAEQGFVNACAVGKPFDVMPPMLFESGQNFAVNLNWQGGQVALPSGFNARVGVRMDGLLYRNSQ